MQAAFSSVYAAFLPSLAGGISTNSETKSQYNLITSILGLDKVKHLTLLKIDDILIELTKLVWDPTHHEVILKLDPSSTPPRPPYISYDDYLASLKYLQVINAL